MKNLLFLSAIVFSFAANIVHAVPYYETVGIANGTLGSTSTVKWLAPNSTKYKVQVYVPTTGTTTNALYRVYPKGNIATNTACSSTDSVHPCFEIAVNQAANQGKWVALMLNNKATTQWAFIKNVGFVSVSANSSASAEVIGVATIRFESPVVFPTIGYSKISNSGTLVADSAVLGVGANDWACTRDNVTKLIWEVKTDDNGLRDKDNAYSWYDPNPATNGGSIGHQNYFPSSCIGGISCDTDGYVKAVNGQKLCGFSDWIMPSSDQLLSLVNTAYSPTINPTYFPNTSTGWVWSALSVASDTDSVWVVGFYYGNTFGSSYKYSRNAVRLVRKGQ